MSEAVLHWDRWATVLEVKGNPPTVMVPIPVVVATADVGRATVDSGAWEFRYRDTDENEVRHYYSEGAPWVSQIRSAIQARPLEGEA